MSRRWWWLRLAPTVQFQYCITWIGSVYTSHLRECIAIDFATRYAQRLRAGGNTATIVSSLIWRKQVRARYSIPSIIEER